MRSRRTVHLALAFLTAPAIASCWLVPCWLATPAIAQPLGRPSEVLVCPLLNAKAMPDGIPVAAMKFTGPSGDGRRGSAGFVVQSEDLVDGVGTRWDFTFQRDPSGFGFQVIHPLKKGHVLVSVLSGVTIHRGGSWASIGWGNPGSSDKVVVTADATRVLPLKTGVPLSVVSQLSDRGTYELRIDGVLICRHQIDKAEPLVLEVPPKARVWGGSGWDRTQFAGEAFESRLEPGHAGLILGPMDGSGPRHFFKQVMLSGVPSSERPETDKHFERLFVRIDAAREFGKLTRTKAVGGGGGGAFEALPDQPSLLTGFHYTTSTFYGGHLTVKSVRPIFRSRTGATAGSWHGVPHGRVHRVEARDGYVVAGIVTQAGHRVDGMRVIFMRVQNGRLNPDDTYRSNWIGGRGGGAPTLSAANGDPVLGIFGRRGHDLDSIGLIQAPAN